MEDGDDSNEDERLIELSSVAAIYPELTVNPKDPYCGVLELPVTPLEPLILRFQGAPENAPSIVPTPATSISQGSLSSNITLTPVAVPVTAAHTEEHPLSHLPGLNLTISLPSGYPEQSPPFVTLSTSPSWLPRRILRALQNKCKEMWEEFGHNLVLYDYIDWLQQAATDAFGLRGEDGRFNAPADLKLALLDFDLRTRQTLFERGTFDCGICLEPKRGLICHRLLACSHVFCVACLQDFYNSCITEGSVDSVKCLTPGCEKERATREPTTSSRKKRDFTLNPSELLQIPLEQAVVQRFVKMKRKQILEASPNTIYCPRQWCQGAARSKRFPKPTGLFNDSVEVTEAEEEAANEFVKALKHHPETIPLGERLAVCEDCDYAFCAVCLKTWHGTGGGDSSICNPRRKAELQAEEKMSEAYMKSFTTPCPTCSAPSQKTLGCNHMICFKCHTHFCYLCSSYLMEDNPYQHFNTEGSDCYMRLWELEAGDGAEHEGAAGALGAVRAGWQEEVDPEAVVIPADPTDEDEEFQHLGVEEDIPAVAVQPAVEVAPRPRNFEVEIINFARDGARHQRIIEELPERLRNPVPPPAPVAPRRPNEPRRRQNRPVAQPRQAARPQNAPRAQAPPARLPPARAPPPALVLPPVELLHEDEEEEEDTDEDLQPQLLPAAPGQGNNVAAGLDRFLALAAADEEDEWDSDELDEIDFEGGGHGAGIAHRRANPEVPIRDRVAQRNRRLGQNR